MSLLSSPTLSAETFPTAIPKTKGELAVIIKAILQKDAAFLKSFKTSSTSASATMKIKNEDVTLVAFKRPGVAKVLLAIVPKNFKLSSFVPIPSGSPVDGVTFSNAALVYVPKGAGKTGVSTSSLPTSLSHSFSNLGGRADFKDGLNIFGEADFQSAGVIRKLLSTVGHSNMRLPLSGAFSADILRYDFKTASRKLKEELFNGLNLRLPLPKLSIPGMPKMVSVKDAHLAIVGREVKGKRKIFAGVTGELDIKLGRKNSAFTFGMFSGDKVELTAESKDKTTLPFFKPLDLTNMAFKATKKNGKWSVSVDAKTKLNNKEMDVTVTKPANAKQFALITTDIKLSDLLPGADSVPGLTDITFTKLAMFDTYVEVRGKVKGADTVVVAFKHNNKRYIAANVVKDFDIGSIIPNVSKTPLSDAKFENMVFVWAPKGGAVKNLDVSVLTPDIEKPAKITVSKIDLKPGVTIFGQMVIEKSSKVGKLLTQVGAYKNKIKLNGTLSAAIFHPGSAANIKNEVLDSLDLKLPLPAVHLPGVPKAVNIQQAVLAIKGNNDKGTRSVVVDVAGRLDVSHGSARADFDFDIDMVRKNGQNRIRIDATEVPETKFTVNMVETLRFSNMSFHMDNFSGKGWNAFLKADTSVRNTPIKIWYYPATSEQPRHINIDPKGLSVGKLLGVGGLPGIDNIKLESVQIYPGQWLFYADVKGVQSYIAAEKAPNGSGHFISVELNDFSPAQLIPGAGGSPLKDAKFKGLTLVYSPLKSATSLDKSGLGKSAADWIRKSNKNPILKPGMNVFGHLDIHPSGEIANLLKEVGVTDLKLPLSGGFSPKALSANPGAIKNEILNNLDITMPLPELKLPGIPKAVDIQHALLAIKGKNGAIDVDVNGRLDVTHGSSKADFDFDVDLVRKDGKNKIKITAKETKTSRFKLPLFVPIELTNMSFEMNNFESSKWSTSLKGDAAIRGTTVSLSYDSQPKGAYIADIDPKNLTIAKLVGVSDLPGLSDVELSSVQIYPGRWFLQGEVKGIKTYFQIQEAPGGHLVAAYLSDLKLSSLIPGSGNSPLKDVNFSNIVAFYYPGKQPTTLKGSGLKHDAYLWAFQSNKNNPQVKPGMNVFGHMDIKPSGELGKLLKDVGVTELKLPLNGGFSPKAFAKNHSAQDIKNSILDNLDIKINLPKLKIPGAGQHLTLRNDRLEIKGKLPDGKRGLSVKVASDAEIKVKREKLAFAIEVDYDRSQGAAETDLEIKGHTDKPWNKPLGINFLDLKELTLDIRKRKTADGTKTYDVDIAAKTDIGSHSKLDVSVEVDEKNGKLEDAFLELDGPLKLSEIPGVKEIPNASHFEIDTIKISEHGIEAKTDFGKNKDLDVFLFTGSGWNLILRQDNFAITEFVPPLNDTPLKHIKLSEAAIVLSKDGLQGPLSNFSIIAQDALKDIYGSKTAHVDVDSGLSLISAFEHKNAGGGLSGALKRLGLAEERVVLTGDIGGLFGGPTRLEVDVVLNASPGAKHQPKWMKSKPGVDVVFSLIANETAPAQFDIEIGIGTDVIANMHGTELDFTAKTALEFEDEKIDVKIVADMKDKKGWKKPFGMPGLTIYEVGYDLGIDVEGAVHMGFDGNVKISGDDYKLAFDADLEGGLIPTDLALIASADKVDFLFIEEIATAMLGGNFSIDMPKGILPSFTGVKFAFATPGAQDPDLGIDGEGFALKGAMNWLDHELGAMGLSINPTSGIAANGKIDDMKLGNILDLKNNHFDFKAGIKGVPSLKLNGDIDVLNFKDTVEVDFGKKGVIFKSSASAGNAFKADVDFELTGVDISAKHPEFKKADFYMKGDLHMDVGKFISGPAKDALDDIFNDMSAGFKKAEDALKGAQDKVNGLTAKINAERAKVRRERAAAESRLQGAENRVNQLNSWINDDWGHYHSCHGWGKWACRARWGIRIGALKGARWGADEALRLAETLVAHFPIDLDPRVAVLITERDAARVALKVVLDAIKGADLIDKFLKDATDAVANELGKAANIDIKKASFEGDLRGIISKDEPMLLGLDIEMFGVEFKENVSFKWKDTPYDVEQMGVMGLHALERVVDDVLHWMPGYLKHKVHNHIASKMDAKQAAAKRELAKYAKDFSAIAASQKAAQDRMAARNVAFLEAKMAEWASPLDHDTSETFSNELVEVGHSGLCLSVAGTSIVQHPCNDDKAQRFSTSPTPGSPIISAKLGYVFIKSSSGECLVPEGTWKYVNKQFSDPKLPKEGAFTFKIDEFQGDGKMTIKKCANVAEMYWKVLKHGANPTKKGGGWMLMANRATNQCLHFSHSSAKPGVAQAEWKACVGSANQVYRLADSASPKYYADYISLRNDQLGLCVGEAAKDTTVSMVTCDKAAFYDYMVDIRGYAKFINYHTGHCLQPGGYGKGAKMTEVPCTQLDYQWWDASPQAGGIIIKNAQTKLCTNPPFNWAQVPPTQVDCAKRNNAVFAPVLGKYRFTGPTWSFAYSDKPLPPKKDRYETKSGDNLCAFEFQGSFVPGLIVGHNGLWHCGTAFSNAVTPEAFNKGKFRLMMREQSDDMVWLPNTGKKLNKLNIPTGGFGGASEANVYTCRAGGKFAIGWTADGKTCHAFNFASAKPTKPATEFAILSRWDKAFYQLQGSASETIEQPTYVPDFPLPPAVKTAPVWIVGTDNSPYAWNPKTERWIRQRGCIKNISVQVNGVPVGIRCDDYVVEWYDNNWHPVGALKASDVGAHQIIYAIDMDGNPRQWANNKWVPHQNCAKRIDVMNNNLPVIIACNDRAEYLQYPKWAYLGSGSGLDIGTGQSTWIVGMDKAPYQWNGKSWIKHIGCIESIDVAKDGTPWAIGCKGGIYRWNGKGWIQMVGKALDIGMQP